MKTVYFHIGPHKTGTTYIQNMLWKNRDYLRSVGVNYPDPENVVERYGVVCHREVLSGGGAALKSLIDPKYDINIISFEGLSLLSEAKISELSEYCALNGYSAKVVYYVRHPYKRLVSFWKEQIKHGSVKSLSAFYLGELLCIASNSNLNYNIVLDKWAKYFGRNSLVLVDYDSCLISNGILNSFLDIVGVALGNCDALLINKSHSLGYVEILKVLNSLACNEGLLNNTNVREIFFSNAVNYLNEIDRILEYMKKYECNFHVGKFHVNFLWNNLNLSYGRNFLENFLLWDECDFKYIDDIWILNPEIEKCVKLIYSDVRKNLI